MCPQGARLGLGQGFRNAPQETPVKAGAGLEECSSGGLREWRLAGVGPQEKMSSIPPHLPQEVSLSLSPSASPLLLSSKADDAE